MTRTRVRIWKGRTQEQKEKRREYETAYRLANRDKVRAREKARYLSNKEKQATYQKARYAKNRGVLLAKQKAYYNENKEERLAFANKYYADNWDKLKSMRVEQKDRRRNRRILRVYGLSQDGYDALMKMQGGGCAICGTTEWKGWGGGCVDHDHKTGAVRGILCFHCNSAIGLLKDNPKLVRAALDYLEGRR
jgi:hypothetical protein